MVRRSPSKGHYSAVARLTDGRNRLEACKFAGVAPRFERLNGQVATAFILSTNLTRRHLRPGARALIVEEARRCREAQGSCNLATDASGASGIDRSRLAEASVVLDYAPDLRAVVFHGGMTLQAAVKIARERKEDAAALNAKKDRLRNEAPDLFELVDEGRQNIDEAIGALKVRQEP